MHKIEIKKTGEIVYHEKLENGLDIYMLPNKKQKNFYITLNTKYGSIHTDYKYKGKEYKNPKGIAHFLEHILFNMPDGSNAFDYYSKLGSNINAFTSFDITCYEVMGNTKFKENLSYLLEYVYTPYFTKEMVEGEKGIITEEIKMLQDNPGSELVYGLYRNIFVNDQRKYLISGTTNDVKKINLNMIETVYDAFYHPENMFLIITGSFNPEEAIAITIENMKTKEIPKYSKPSLRKEKEPFKINKDVSEKAMPVDKHNISFGIKIAKTNFKSLKLTDLELRTYLNLIMKINFGRTSLLKEELSSNGIITENISTHITVTDEYYVLALISATEYPDYLIKRFKEKLADLVISKEEVERKIKVSISNLILSFDEIENVNSDIQDDIINYDKYIDDIYLQYKKLDAEIAEQIIKKMSKHLLSITILTPKEEN